MTTTRRQRAEVAMGLVLEHLTELTDPAYEMNDWIDSRLGLADDVDEDQARTEIADVRALVADAVAVLRLRLAKHAQFAHGIDPASFLKEVR